MADNPEHSFVDKFEKHKNTGRTRNSGPIDKRGADDYNRHIILFSKRYKYLLALQLAAAIRGNRAAGTVLVNWNIPNRIWSSG